MKDDRPRPDIEDLKRLYAEGLSVTAIAREVGFNGNTIKKWLEGAGVDVQPRYRKGKGRPNPRRPSDPDLKQMYVDERMTVAEISERLDIPTGTIAYWLGQIEGVVMRPTGGLPSERLKDGRIWRKVVGQAEKPYDRDWRGDVLTVTMDVLECGHQIPQRIEFHQSGIHSDHKQPIPKERNCRTCEKQGST